MLEGDLDGVALSLIGYPDRGALEKTWDRHSERLRSAGARACAVARAA